MAINKNAQLRYKVLDECFSNWYKKFFIEDLIEICSERISDYYGEGKSISRRQILEDIKFMESADGYDAPIERLREGKRVYYRYEDRDFSIHKKPLTTQELEVIQEAITISARIQGTEWAERLLVKLKSGTSVSPEKIIDFEENKYLKGIEFLNPLYQFIINRQVLSIDYKPFTEENQQLIISPYYLKQYNNRWFLLGQNHDKNYLQILALDRIEKITASGQKFIENQTDFEDYFDEVIGVTNFKDKEIEEIQIELAENIIPYVKSKPLHHSQKINANILKMRVKQNYELETLILSYGENMQVLSPEKLKNKIIERLKLSVNQYFDGVEENK